jgi:hypothetical protein
MSWHSKATVKFIGLRATSVTTKHGARKSSVSPPISRIASNTNPLLGNPVNTSLRAIRVGCAITFVAGIAGMIISSVDGNNVGRVTTIGVFSAIGAIVLLTASSIANRQRIDAFDDAAAEQLERHIASLVAHGTDETTLRKLVRDAARLGRSVS